MTETRPTRRGEMPKWLAGVIIAIIVALAGYWGYHQLTTERGGEVVVVNERGGGGGRFQRGARDARAQRQPPQPSTKVTKSGGIIYVQADPMRLRARPQGNGKYVLDADYEGDVRYGFLGPKWQMLFIVSKLDKDPAMARHIGLTDAQTAKLAYQPVYPELTAAEKTLIAGLVGEWERVVNALAKTDRSKREERAKLDAARQAAENKLIEAVKAAGAAHLQETKTRFVQQVEAYSNVLTPEQIEKARTYTPPPATRPTPTLRRNPAPARQPSPAPAPTQATTRPAAAPR